MSFPSRVALQKECNQTILGLEARTIVRPIKDPRPPPLSIPSCLLPDDQALEYLGMLGKCCLRAHRS